MRPIPSSVTATKPAATRTLSRWKGRRRKAATATGPFRALAGSRRSCCLRLERSRRPPLYSPGGCTTFGRADAGGAMGGAEVTAGASAWSGAGRRTDPEGRVVADRPVPRLVGIGQDRDAPRARRRIAEQPLIIAAHVHGLLHPAGIRRGAGAQHDHPREPGARRRGRADRRRGAPDVLDRLDGHEAVGEHDVDAESTVVPPGLPLVGAGRQDPRAPLPGEDGVCPEVPRDLLAHLETGALRGRADKSYPALLEHAVDLTRLLLTGLPVRRELPDRRLREVGDDQALRGVCAAGPRERGRGQERGQEPPHG